MEPVNVQLAPLMPDGLYDMHGGYNYTPSLWGHREDRTFSALQPDPPSSRSENSTRSDIKKQSSENNGSSSENTGIFYWNKVFICFVCMYHLIAYFSDRFCNNNLYITLLTNRTSNFFIFFFFCYHFCKMPFVSKLNLYHINKIHKCMFMIVFIKVTLRIQIWKCLLFNIVLFWPLLLLSQFKLKFWTISKRIHICITMSVRKYVNFCTQSLCSRKQKT